MAVIRLFIFVLLFLPACQQASQEGNLDALEEVPLMYAKGFALFRGNNFYVLEIIQSPDTKQRFLIYDPEEEVSMPDLSFDGKVPMGSHKVILSATPQVAHLDYLQAEDHLMAFPDLDLITSESVRRRIDENRIIDLGKGPMTNMEKIIDLQPDWVMISGFGEPFKLADRLGAASIPVIINQEFLEKHPLGRAEWIKVTGVLLGKEKEAMEVYSEIVTNYNASSELMAKVAEDKKPSVLSGSLYKDIWYAPGKDSWAAKIIADAGGHYLFDKEGDTGSLTLNYEFVLDQAGQADYWIGAANYVSLGSMVEQNPKYGAFKAYKEKQIYTYTLGMGATGGLRYFEEGYLRPDLVLLDMIKILHPEEAREHKFRYFEKLED
ncbi:ABC transporter substrate-binding protein [Cyclobacterium qasimii]|uniref:ABC transporter substrate-binding protein n=2 Tax=Cyclobacterium qasimii TaxID=1350429 RepID=A0A512C9H2_9BACT|nr:ABC transporter substrate-binding protein [Cyclobacterium qasimii]EPR65020.1 putative iron(III) ABC transporter periplasmic iron-binding protein [Cyclobacterium qasimii M12-11B]GEO20868.1 ABC transporter substrate-binding protein [Cyclobacterium qasimii]